MDKHEIQISNLIMAAGSVSDSQDAMNFAKAAEAAANALLALRNCIKDRKPTETSVTVM